MKNASDFVPANCTLFDPEVARRWISDLTGWTSEVPGLEPTQIVDEGEAATFERLLEERAVPLFRWEGWAGHQVFGPLVVREPRGVFDLDRPLGDPYRLPTWVEADGLEFEECGAEGILLCEKDAFINRLTTIDAFKERRFVTLGCGIPNPRLLRFVHRLAEEHDLPVYVIGDNDTWGYFLFSVLVTGSVIPGRVEPFLACPGARYLGVRTASGDKLESNVHISTKCVWDGVSSEPSFYYPGCPLWDLRIAALMSYPCFSSAKWQAELEAFQKRGDKVEMEAFSVWEVDRYYNELITKPLDSGDHLGAAPTSVTDGEVQ